MGLNFKQLVLSISLFVELWTNGIWLFINVFGTVPDKIDVFA